MKPQTVDQPQHLPSTHKDSLREIEKGYWWYVARVRWAKRLIDHWLAWESDKQPTYADIGCGTGGFAKALQEHYYFSKIVLVDGDYGLLQSIDVPPSFECVHHDIEKDFSLPWHPSLVSCMDVIEHLKDDVGFLQRIHKLLPPSGLLILSVPAMPSLFSEWDRVLGHHRRYRPKDLKRKLEQAGFKNLRVHSMWSFLLPIAPYRKWKGKKYKESASFEEVPPWVNQSLITLSDIEWQLNRLIRFPFGTSLIVSATKR